MRSTLFIIPVDVNLDHLTWGSPDEVLLVRFLHGTVTLFSLSLLLYSWEGGCSLGTIAHAMHKGNCAPPPGRSCISSLVLKLKGQIATPAGETKYHAWVDAEARTEMKENGSLQNAQEWPRVSFSVVSYGLGRSSEKEGALEESGDLNFFINSSCMPGLERDLI